MSPFDFFAAVLALGSGSIGLGCDGLSLKTSIRSLNWFVIIVN